MRNTQRLERTKGRRAARLLPLLIVVTGLTPAGMAIPCRAQGAAPAAPVAPAQQKAALAGAQGLVAKMLQMGGGNRDLAGMSHILTNRSAGAVGVLMSGVLGMGIGLGSDLSGGQGKTPSGLSQAQLKSDYDAFQTRWGLGGKEASPASGVPTSLPPAVAKDGRGFLAAVAALMSRIAPEQPQPSGSRSVPSAHDFTYTVLSPTRVRLAMKPGAMPMPPSEAVLEGGQWRLDLGDLKTLSSTLGNSTVTDPPAPLMPSKGQP